MSRSAASHALTLESAFLGYRGTGNDVTAAVRFDQAEAALRRVQGRKARACHTGYDLRRTCCFDRP